MLRTRWLGSLTTFVARAAESSFSWADVENARKLLDGLFQQYSNRNTSTVGAFCPSPVFMHASNSLDLHHMSGDAGNCAWSDSAQTSAAICKMAEALRLSPTFRPTFPSSVAQRRWEIGNPFLNEA